MEYIEPEKKPWAGYIVSAVPVLFLLIDAGMKLAKPELVVTATIELGYKEGVIVPLGIVLLVSVILYLVPKTAIVGAIMLTAYLGGAVATHYRLGNSLFGHILFPVYVGILLWLGLYLRDRRLRELVPLRS
jgi:hypothetical protein